MKLHLNQEIFNKNPELLPQYISMLNEDILFLRGAYPNFDKWLHTKVIPGIKNGERSLIIETRDDRVAGIMILKNDGDEKKLCTLRVRPEYESLGLGIRLFNEAFKTLETEKPLLSVSDAALPKFDKIFKYFGFNMEGEYRDLYVSPSTEISYNGLLFEKTYRKGAEGGLYVPSSSYKPQMQR